MLSSTKRVFTSVLPTAYRRTFEKVPLAPAHLSKPNSKGLAIYRSCSSTTIQPGLESINVNEHSPLWINHLENEGYAVVPNVLTPGQCNDVIDKAWEWLTALGTGIQRDDPSTWTDDRWPKNYKGIIQRYKIGHAPFLWETRSNKNVINVFKEIWGTEELLCSFDAMCILRPVELVPDLGEMSKFSYWFHTDQSPNKKELHCVQGFLNLENVTTEDASFVCYPKSHKLHEEMFSRSKNDPGMDFYRLTEEEVKWVEHEKGLSHVKVIPPKGALVVFDSRLLHCNSPAVYPRKEPKWRYVIYICMTPRAWADNKTLRARIDAFEKQRMTTHWPHHLGLFPEDVEDVKVPKYQVELNDVVKRLVGMQGYDGKDEHFEGETDTETGSHERPAL